MNIKKILHYFLYALAMGFDLAMINSEIYFRKLSLGHLGYQATNCIIMLVNF